MKNTQPHLEFPTPPPTVERGVLLPAPVLSRIGALFSSFLLPPTSICTGILSPKFCLKLERVKRLLEFHGNLLWFEGMTQYFPSLIIDQECGYWVQRWRMISGLCPPPPNTASALALGFLSDVRLPSLVFIEGLLCGRSLAGQ